MLAIDALALAVATVIAFRLFASAKLIVAYAWSVVKIDAMDAAVAAAIASVFSRPRRSWSRASGRCS